MIAAELDVLVVGGGIVGAGAALDAVTRGLSVGLLEQRDLASGTSSRSSKLVHGGLRYLEMFDFALVKEALEERGLLLTRLAPHLVRPVPFLYPLTKVWERPYVGAGVALYDAMAMTGKYDMGVPKHKHIFRKQLARMAPDIKTDELHGAIRYYDCQVDDARLVMTIARTAANNGAQIATRPRSPASCARATGSSASTAPRPRERRRVRGARQGRHQRRRRVDRRGPGADRRRRDPRRRRQQGHPPGRAARPHPLRVRLHHQDREVGALRHPVGRLLDHRHHRHPVGPRPRAPVGQQDRHRLHPRPRQLAAEGPARPPRRGGRLRRPAAAAQADRRARASGARRPSSRASTPSPTRCPASC